MKTIALNLLNLLLLFFASSACAQISLYVKHAPPELVERARQLAAKEDYPGMEAMIAEVDARYVNDCGKDYFRCLLGIRSAVSVKWDATKPNFPREWMEKKLTWKILLTP